MIKPYEAFLVLDKLCSEKAVVACVGSLFGWTLTMRGRFSEVSESEFTFVSFDGRAAVVLRLDLDDLVFEYAQPKDLPPSQAASIPEAAREASGLVIGLPMRVSPADLEGPLHIPFREKLCFVEIPEGTESKE